MAPHRGRHEDHARAACELTGRSRVALRVSRFAAEGVVRFEFQTAECDEVESVIARSVSDEAIHRATSKKAGLLRFARNDGESNHSSASPAARCARAFASPPSQNKRAQGKPGARCTRGPVCNCYWQEGTRAYRFSGGIPTFPARWVTAYSELSPVTGLFCHRRPPEVLLPANLTPASGCQDHTALPSATSALVIRRHRVHRIPARVRDDRETPLSSGGMAALLH